MNFWLPTILTALFMGYVLIDESKAESKLHVPFGNISLVSHNTIWQNGNRQEYMKAYQLNNGLTCYVYQTSVDKYSGGYKAGQGTGLWCERN